MTNFRTFLQTKYLWSRRISLQKLVFLIIRYSPIIASVIFMCREPCFNSPLKKWKLPCKYISSWISSFCRNSQGEIYKSSAPERTQTQTHEFPKSCKLLNFAIECGWSNWPLGRNIYQLPFRTVLSFINIATATGEYVFRLLFSYLLVYIVFRHFCFPPHDNMDT